MARLGLVVWVWLFSIGSASAQVPPPPSAPAAAVAANPADPQPSTGNGAIIAGWIVAGAGAAALAVIPLCFADFYPPQASDACAIGQGLIGGVALTVGVTLLVVGYNRRADYRAWQERNPTALRLPNVGLLADSHRIGLSYQLPF